MSKQKVWRNQPLPSEIAIKELQKSLGTSTLLSTLLVQRKITTREKAYDFFLPDLKKLHPPFLLKGMESALSLIKEGLQKKWHIRIYGDYDVDGVTSLFLLYAFLKKEGGDLSYYIPDRYGEGYGISLLGAQKAIEEGVDLLIAVDCGTRALAPIEKMKEGGVRVIVCDHHEPGAILPKADVFINPKQRECTYPFKELSACGLVFKLIQAFALKEGKEAPFDQLPWVALSIAADIVPMCDENRILAFHGLKKIGEGKAKCLQKLLKKREITPENPPTISDLVFQVAPVLNAPGRLTKAYKALDFLLCNDERALEKSAEELIEQNQLRKDASKALIQEALREMEKLPPSRTTNVLSAPHWSKGLLGIAAAQCVEKDHRPTILLTQEGNEWVGSARSVIGVNIYQALLCCKPYLSRFGGHAYAAGLSLPLEALHNFTQIFDDAVAKSWAKEKRDPLLWIDRLVAFSELTRKACRTIDRMAPFGPGHQKPLFLTKNVSIDHFSPYQGGHMGLWVFDSTSSKKFRGVAFNMPHLLECFQKSGKKALYDVVYQVEKNYFRGGISHQLIFKDIRPATLFS